KAISDKIAAGRVYDMHHAIASKYNPTYTPMLLPADGFTKLRVRFTEAGIRPNFPAPPTQRVLNETKRAVNLILPPGMRFDTNLDRQLIFREMMRYKAENKRALQYEYGLRPDPNAIVAGWASRYDSRQKGFVLVLS